MYLLKFFFISALAITLGECYGTQLSNAGKCSILEKAIANFIKNRSQPDTLYSIFEVQIFVKDALLNSLMKSSGYKFAVNSKDLHSFSCKLVGARSRSDVAKILGVSSNTMNGYYNTMIGPIIEVGGVNHMRDVSQVVGLLMAWSDSTGYPVMPFKSLNDKLTLKTFQALKKVMMKKHVHDALINSPFPLKVSPERALKFLKSAKSYSELERGVFMDPHTLEDFAMYVKQHKDAIPKGSNNVRSTMAFIDALERTGLLYLK